MISSSNSLVSQTKALRIQPDGNDVLYCVTADSGYRNLLFGVGEGTEELPDLDVSWARDALVNPTTNAPPVFILGVYHIDLLPNDDSDRVVVRCFEENKLKRLVASIAPELNNKLKDVQVFFSTHPLASEALRRLTQKNPASDSKKLFTQLKFALAYEAQPRSAHNLVWQLIKTVLHPKMRWLWVIPAIFKMENQVDRLEEFRRRNNPNGPLIWHISNTVQTLLVTVDMVLFGVPRDYRFTAKKYGINVPELIALTHKVHPRMSDEYALRKAKSIEVARIMLRASGQHELCYWIFNTLKGATASSTHPSGKIDDACEVVCEIYDHFNSCTRTQPYNKKEVERVAAHLKQIEDKNHLNTVSFIDNTTDPYDAELDAATEEKHQRKIDKPATASKKIATKAKKVGATAASAASSFNIADYMVRHHNNNNNKPVTQPKPVSAAAQKEIDALLELEDDFFNEEHDEELEQVLRLSALEAENIESDIDNIPLPVAVRQPHVHYEIKQTKPRTSQKRKANCLEEDEDDDIEDEKPRPAPKRRRLTSAATATKPDPKPKVIRKNQLILLDDDDEDDNVWLHGTATDVTTPKKKKRKPISSNNRLDASYFTGNGSYNSGGGGFGLDSFTQGEERDWGNKNGGRHRSLSSSSSRTHTRTADEMMLDYIYIYI